MSRSYFIIVDLHFVIINRFSDPLLVVALRSSRLVWLVSHKSIPEFILRSLCFENLALRIHIEQALVLLCFSAGEVSLR